MAAFIVSILTLVVSLLRCESTAATSASLLGSETSDTKRRPACVESVTAANVTVWTCTGDFRSTARLLPDKAVCRKCVILVRDSIVDLRYAPLSPQDVQVVSSANALLRYCFINTTFVSWSRDWLLDLLVQSELHFEGSPRARQEIELFFDSVSMSDTTEWRKWVTRFDLCQLSALSFARSESLLLAFQNDSLVDFEPPYNQIWWVNDCSISFIGAFDMNRFDDWSVILKQFFTGKSTFAQRMRLSDLGLRSIPQYLLDMFLSTPLDSEGELPMYSANISTLERYFSPPKKWYLILDNNPLGQIGFSGRVSFGSLSLRNTSLRSYSYSQNFKVFGLLDLRDNLLTYIDVDLIKHFPKTIRDSAQYNDVPDCFRDGWTYLDLLDSDSDDSGSSEAYGYSRLLLDNNPWECNSSLRDSMIEFVKYYETLKFWQDKSLINEISVTMPKCSEPSWLRGLNWSTALQMMATLSSQNDAETNTDTNTMINSELWLLVAIVTINTVLIVATTATLRRSIYSDRDELPAVLPTEFAAVCEIRLAA